MGAGRLQLVVMKVSGRSFALPIIAVDEVLPMVAMTEVPEAPDWVAGVMDLRGRVLPVVDLRRRLDLPATEIDLGTPIVVAQEAGRSIGLIVDEVDDVLTVPDDAYERPDDVVSSSLVSGLVKHGDRLIVVLALPPLYAGTEDLLVSNGAGASA